MAEMQKYIIGEEYRARFKTIIDAATEAIKGNSFGQRHIALIMLEELRFLGYIYGFDPKTATNAPYSEFYVILARGDVLTPNKDTGRWEP